MRGILINPETGIVKEVKYLGDYREIYHLIGASPFDVQDITERDSVFFDDEFLLNAEDSESPLAYFRFIGPELFTPTWIGGKGLILGVNAKGMNIGTRLSLDLVQRNVTFARKTLVGWTPPREYDDNGTLVYVGPQPIWADA